MRSTLIALSLVGASLCACTGEVSRADRDAADPGDAERPDRADGRPDRARDATRPSEHTPAACGCLLGEGPYCGGRAGAEAKRAGCAIAALGGHQGDLLRCERGEWSLLESCAASCTYTAGSNKLDDHCELPVCPCFVQVAWCGSGAAKEAATRGCQIPLLPAHNGDILYCPGGSWAVKQTCPNGCIEEPAGTPDSCRASSDYHLPFDCGTSQTCSNGVSTSSHTGKDEYAYDFAMPVGTAVRAMRAGEVLRVRLVSGPGDPCFDGGGSGCSNYANTVEVRHLDGTVGLYMHLSSAAVAAGQGVTQGQLVGHSGNSGYSTGPHLHCQVQSDCGIWWCQSIPFVFVEGPPLAAGVTAVSQNCP